MPLAPHVAPPYELSGNPLGGNSRVHQQHQQHQQPHQYRVPVVPKMRLSRTAVNKSRRRRSRSRDSRTTPQQRKNLRNKVLAGLLLVTVAILTLFRQNQLRHVEEEYVGVLDRGEFDFDHEDEEARLRIEVQGLEDAFLSKKALLGIPPGLPLDHRNAPDGGRDSNSLPGEAGDRPEEDPSPVEVGRQQMKRPAASPSDQQYQHYQHSQDNSPLILKGYLAGEAMFGGSKPPLRPSLESQPSLIREPVPLIVGGTDGSGTRGVVALLQRLEVPMVVEDRGTMDVHGAPYMVKGGWPMVVRPVIEWARGTGYEPRVAPAMLRRTTFDALGNLRVEMEKLARKLRPTSGRQAAKHVSWGFKAPVSMVLVPFFEEAWGKAKFLHVVRDGRDIAFSGNQTPVEKFYAETFPKGSRESGLKEAPVRAMALWNSWNVGVHQWAASQKERGAEGLDYLLLHAEDLIDPDAKFAAIKDVAEFVGSPLSDFELCCIATEGSKDMGSHTKSKKDRGQITSRFGKWKSQVEGNPQLSKLLHDEGEVGLRTFGYEPERSLRLSGGFQCPAERDPTCPKALASPSASRPSRSTNPRAKAKVPVAVAHVPAAVVDTATCVGLKTNTDFQGFDLKVGHAEEHLGCCQECRKVDDCSYFTFDRTSGVCYLKFGKGAENYKDGLVSGMVMRP